MRKLTLDQAKEKTEARGFRWLSETYEGNAKKHLFACSQGHEWEARPSRVWSDRGCPHCAGRLPLTLEQAKERTEARGFRFVSESFRGVDQKHLFACSQGHEWGGRPHVVWRGSGCPHCAGNATLTLEQAKERTEEMGFRLVSESFRGVDQKHLFACSQGHEWEAAAGSVWRGNGCPHCAGNATLTLEQAKERTEARGFRWISESYEGALKKHLFGCSQGHEWEASAASVWAGCGCPHCSSLKSESLVRKILAEDFGIATEKVRPDWLRHRKGRLLELDGFQGEIGFAWEHQGDQHFRFDPFFHRGGEKAFLAQQERDAFKREETARQKILLFEIPQTKEATREKIKETIEREAERCCLPFVFNPAFREMLHQDWPDIRDEVLKAYRLADKERDTALWGWEK